MRTKKDTVVVEFDSYACEALAHSGWCFTA
jgi:hypothetical protein